MLKRKQPKQTEEELEQFEEDEEELEEEAEEEEEVQAVPVKKPYSTEKPKGVPIVIDGKLYSRKGAEKLMYPPKFRKYQDDEDETWEYKKDEVNEKAIPQTEDLQQAEAEMEPQPQQRQITVEEIIAAIQNLSDRVTSLEASAFRMRGAI